MKKIDHFWAKYMFDLFKIFSIPLKIRFCNDNLKLKLTIKTYTIYINNYFLVNRY